MHRHGYVSEIAATALLLWLIQPAPSEARIKLVALPERGPTTIRLDNPQATLIEEERVLTLQQGVNKVDFSWNGVSIDVDSIRLAVLTDSDGVKLLNVSYPPNEAALVWELSSDKAREATVRISYLLSNIDRLITYTAVANKAETTANLRSYLVLRNFSGEDFANARVQLDYGEAFDAGIQHEETRQLLFLEQADVPLEKIWTFDAALKPWDSEKLENQNVGIPVSYRVENTVSNKLGKFALWDGKVRVYQDDGHGGKIVLGEDNTDLVPVGEKMEVCLGDSRDIVVTQRKQTDKQINIRRNNQGVTVLYDTDEEITVKMENFKDSPAVLTLIEHISGQWDMEACNLTYKLDDFDTLKFEIPIAAHATENLTMHYHRRNLR